MHIPSIFTVSLAAMCLLATGGCGSEASEPASANEFERFHIDWGWGPCPDEVDCSGFVELRADGTLRLDTPCNDGMACDHLAAGSYEVVIPAQAVAEAAAVLTSNALITLLDGAQPVCEAPSDIGETMTLELDRDVHTNRTTFCENAPLQTSRALMSDLVADYINDDGPTLTAVGWSFGECVGPCVGELAVTNDTLRYTIRDWQPDGDVYFEAEATLSEFGHGQLKAVLSELAGTVLKETYGCPDCADGGTAQFTLTQANAESTHRYEYGNPPVELTPLDAIKAGWMNALEACTDTAALTVASGCIPRKY